VEIAPTPPGWLEAVLSDFDSFLKDHASCEKKASGMALNIASHYPDQPGLLRAMADLAVEELTHYREVVRLLLDRGLSPGADQRDSYVRALNDLIRTEPEYYLLDRLLIAAVVERRGSERFGLVAAALAQRAADPALINFYQAITASEGRHWSLFVTLAEEHCDTPTIPGRLAELIEAEASIMRAQPFRPALH
jgi:tRNA-(ms[2]io[6]A)-hydroxylase